MGAAAAAVAPDVVDRVGPFPSPAVTAGAPPTELDSSAAAAATPEPVPAMMAGREGPPEAAVAAAIASSAAVGALPQAPPAPQQQPMPESARTDTRMASRVAAAAIDAAVMGATATASATMEAGRGTSEASTPPARSSPPRAGMRAQGAAWSHCRHPERYAPRRLGSRPPLPSPFPGRRRRAVVAGTATSPCPVRRRQRHRRLLSRRAAGLPCRLLARLRRRRLGRLPPAAAGSTFLPPTGRCGSPPRGGSPTLTAMG